MAARDPTPDDVERWLGVTVGGKYRIERLLGRGGMGAVFAAENTAIGKRVALKFLGAEAARDRDAARRFQREAQAASLVESEHIVQVFDAGTTPEGLPFLVMEQLNGEDLRALLTREHTLPAPLALRITEQVLRGLVRAHAAGIVHRDLKPDNVFLTARDDGSLLVKLVDFGISKLERGTMSERLTRRGTVLGSAYYMSPEQAQASDDVDQRADLYGVGAMLFEMLAGRPPHQGPTLESVLVAICTQTAPSIQTFCPEVSPGLSAAIARALEREPAARFANATAFLEALSHASSAPGRTPPRVSGTWVAGVVATLIGFSVTAVVIATRGRTPSSLQMPSASATPPEPLAELPPPVPPTVAPVLEADTPPLATASVTTRSKAAPPKPGPALAAKPTSERKRPATPGRADAGVASSLQLSTREP